MFFIITTIYNIQILFSDKLHGAAYKLAYISEYSSYEIEAFFFLCMTLFFNYLADFKYQSKNKQQN